MSALLAVCLLTCNRPELTRVTAESFFAYNAPRLDKMAWLHADGGSDTLENCQIATACGFQTILAPQTRISQIETLRAFVSAATDRKCEYVVWLENDWESVAPLPSDAWIRAANVETIRLFGERKFRSGHRMWAGKHRITTKELLRWDADQHGWERGQAHWGGGATIVRTDLLVREAHRRRLKDVINALDDLSSLRPTRNLMWCVGVESTEGIIG